MHYAHKKEHLKLKILFKNVILIKKKVYKDSFEWRPGELRVQEQSHDFILGVSFLSFFHKQDAHLLPKTGTRRRNTQCLMLL